MLMPRTRNEWVTALLVGASFAFADDGGDKGKGKDKQTDSQKCHNVSLKGTAPATTFTVTVEKANKAEKPEKPDNPPKKDK